MCVKQSSHLPGSSLVLVGIGCRRLTSYLLCFLEKSLPAGSPAEPGTSTPGRLCSDGARCLRAPACLAEPLATHRVSLYSDLFFFDSSRQHHPASRAAHASGSQQQHLHGLLCPPGECGGRRAEKSTCMGKGGKEGGIEHKCSASSPGSWLDWELGTEIRDISAFPSMTCGKS